MPYVEQFEEEEPGSERVEPNDIDEVDEALGHDPGGRENQEELAPSLVRVDSDDQRRDEDEGKLEEFGEELPIVDHVLDPPFRLIVRCIVLEDRCCI